LLLLLLLRTYRKKPQKSHIKISKKFPKTPIKTHKTLKKKVLATSYIILNKKISQKKIQKDMPFRWKKTSEKKTKKRGEDFQKIKEPFS